MTQDNHPAPESTTILLGASMRLVVTPGRMVLVEEAEGDAFGAVLVEVVGCEAILTFTPPGRPRRVPLGTIVCSLGDKSATLDLSSIPEYQPAPTVVPYRSRRVVVDDVPSMQ